MSPQATKPELSLKEKERRWSLLREKLNLILSRHTGQPLEKIQDDTERDRFMGGEASVQYGLIDQVLARRPVCENRRLAD